MSATARMIAAFRQSQIYFANHEAYADCNKQRLCSMIEELISKLKYEQDAAQEFEIKVNALQDLYPDEMDIIFDKVYSMLKVYKREQFDAILGEIE
jgi:hypothetical protein